MVRQRLATNKVYESFEVVPVGLDGGEIGFEMSLRDQVEQLLPGWRRWYPSLFDAARDLGLIRARVCSPDSLLLTKRHARVRQAAEESHREKWGGKSSD